MHIVPHIKIIKFHKCWQRKIKRQRDREGYTCRSFRNGSHGTRITSIWRSFFTGSGSDR